MKFGRALLAAALVVGLLPSTAFARAGSSLQPEALTPQSVDAPSPGIAAQSAKSASKTTKRSAAFTIKNYQKSKKYAYASGKWAYGKPVLKGSSKMVKAINKSLDKRYQKFRGGADVVIDYAKEAGPVYKNASFINTYATEATYNGNGYISFKYASNWFAGGVANGGLEGDVYSLKTGKKLNVSQVVSGSASQVKGKIVKAIETQLHLNVHESSRYVSSAYSKIMAKKISDFEFYLENGKVVVAIEPYTWPGQRHAISVTLAGNYE